MKKLLLATTILVPFAVAYDGTTASAQTAPPTYNWSGFYVGGQVGGGLMKQPSAGNTESLTQFGGRLLLGGNSAGGNGTGAIAGGQAGYNYQMGNWLFGVEGEGFWSGIKMASTGSRFNPNGTILDTFGTIVKNTSDYTIAGRLGIVFDRTLIYGKGGWAWGSHNFFAFDTCCNPTPTTSTASASGTLDGMMVGIGLEHALTQNWTVKLEYDYIGFGPKELLVTACSGTVCITPNTTSFNSTKQVFKVGTNYLFHVGGP